jgi:chemotaxis protein methyltransferase CheR
MLNIQEEEMAGLLEAIFHKYGHDYRQYSRAHVKRRIGNHMIHGGYRSVGELLDGIMADQSKAAALLQELSITVTEMFRDPEFYRTLREKVVPLLRTWSHIRVWHAGCSTGEEVYSMAILLKEEGLYDRTRIYATDLNRVALEKAQEGIYPIAAVREYARNYQRTSPKGEFTDYCIANYGSAIMDRSLKKNIIWAEHNLVTDSDFAEVQMILCRNVMIYFDRELQQRVHRMFHHSLVNGGILCLGAKESIEHTEIRHNYSVVDRRSRIYRKNYPK